jgi:outer membrane protein assembly factor BamB
MKRCIVVSVVLCLVAGVALCGCKKHDTANAAKTPGAAPGAQPAANPPVGPAGQQVAQATATPAVGAQTSVGGGSDWPRFQGPTGDSLAPSQGIKANWTANPPPKLWETAMSDGGFAGPAEANGKVYIIDHRGQQDVVRCIDLGSGQDVWTYPYDEPGGDNYGYSRATPCVSGGKTYTCSRSGLLNCLDANSGAKLWSRSLKTDFGGTPPQWNYAASPIVDGDRLVVVPGGPKGLVAVLNKDSGATIWQGGGTDAASYATPVPATINGAKQYVVFNCKSLAGVSADGGKLLWRVGWETGCDVNAATPLIDGSLVVITSGYNHGCAGVEVKGSSARIAWQNKAIQAHFSSSVLYNGKVYGIGDPGNLVCLNPGDGKVLWQQAGFEKGGLIVVDGMLLAFQGGNGALAQVKADASGYQEIGRFTPLGGQSWTAPIVARGRLIVRNKTTLACFQLG